MHDVKYFVASWHLEGFESMIDITEYYEDNTTRAFELLAGNDTDAKTAELNRLISGMKLRAQFNTQRYYEVYAFSADESFTEESLWEWVDTNPQSLVDLIRERGYKIYSDRASKPKVLIS